MYELRELATFTRRHTFGDHAAVAAGDGSDVHECVHRVGLEKFHPATHRMIRFVVGELTHEGISPMIRNSQTGVDHGLRTDP